MSVYIDSISQATDYQDIRAQYFQIVQKRSTDTGSIISGMTSTYHINDTEGIQICISFEEKNNGSILTLSQSGRILLVGYGQATNIILLNKIKFLLRTVNGLRAIQRIHYTPTYSRNTFKKCLAVMEYEPGTSRLVHQMFRSNMPDTGHHCQSNTINLFFFGAIHFR